MPAQLVPAADPSLSPPSIRHIRQALGLSRERMARVLDVSAKSIERWEAQDALPPNRYVRRVLGQLQEIVDLGLVVFTADGFRKFMANPLPLFDGRTALQLVEDGRAEEVFGELAGLYEGLGF